MDSIGARGSGRAFFLRSLGWALAVRFALLAVALFFASQIAFGRPVEAVLSLFFSQWDAAHYLGIAQDGYGAGVLSFQIAFFPFYPLCAWLLEFLVGNLMLSALLVSLAASVAAGYFLQRLAALDFGEKPARWSLAFFYLFPTAYFLALPYTEALFLALSTASFFFARKGDWRAAGIAGMLACLTRIFGILLFPALLFEAWQSRKASGLRRAAWLLVIPLGLLAYLGLNWQVAGSPLAFLGLQRSYWSHEPVLPWELVPAALAELGSALNGAPVPVNALAMLTFFASASLVLLSGWRRLRPSCYFYSFALLASMLAFSSQASMPRYLLSVFPLFFVLGGFSSRHRIAGTVLLLSSSLSMLHFSRVFFSGGWAF